MNLGPAIQLFDEFRSARLSRRYYEHRLARARNIAFWVDVVTLASTSTLVLGLWLFKQAPFGPILVNGLAITAAAASIFQLVAKPGETAAALEAHVAVYEQLDAALASMVRRIKAGAWSEAAILVELESAMSAARSVHLRRVEAKADDEIMNQLYERVNREIPSNYFA